VEAVILAWVIVISAALIAILAILRQDTIAVGIILVVHLYLDWYLGLRVLALPMIIVFLAASLWMRSSWLAPPALWLWGLLLMLAIFRGTLSLYDTLYYYPNVFVAALITFWLGAVIAQDATSIYRLFKMLAALAAALAIHTIIAAETGVILFALPSPANLYVTAFSYELASSDFYRMGSFFVDPNWNGSFLALMLFIALGLFAASKSLVSKALFLIEILLLPFALLFTFSAGAWVSCVSGLILFLIFVGPQRRTLIFFMAVILLTMVIWLRPELNSLLEHASDPVALSVRQNAWDTALRAIFAFPLTGVGLGLVGYAARVEPFHGPTDLVALDHPHNSYLELGAMAGLPVLITFIAILLIALWRAVINWARADISVRPLFAGGLTSVIVLSINSMTINAWTLPPLAAVGWLILGVISSPLLSRGVTAIDQSVT
jgi:hypothetical protein